ncbi:MAG: hypothetical protein KDD45_16180, partial [Bdellovibrionales bacterium]|nr:hypothetical protein [Bdellovibrionales bacterium]
RWIAPLNKEKICLHAGKFKKILIVDECRQTGSLSESLVAMLIENKVSSEIEVLAAHDCFITLGVAAAEGLPSKEGIKEKIKSMISLQKKSLESL